MTAEEEMSNTEGHAIQMEGVDITAKQDGGVLKLVKKEGACTEQPMTGDKVFVHYVGTLLDGTKFDSSRDRGDKFSFELGKGQVIKAWDLGVGTMKVGEVSQFICKPEYAYGSAGSPPKIPPNATLVFEVVLDTCHPKFPADTVPLLYTKVILCRHLCEMFLATRSVELFEFRGEDITDDEDGGIIRRTITKGEGYSKPNEGATVEVAVEGIFEERVFDQRNLKFEIGDCESLDLPAGVEKAITAMEQGEESTFTITAKYGYGSAGSTKFNIPPGATLKYKIKLKAFEKAKESWEMNTSEKLEQGAIVKEKGTQYFKEGKFKQATGQYKKIVSWLEHESGLSEEDEQKARALRLAAHLNLAMCYLKLQEETQALENCNKALELDQSNEKALFRRGEALCAMKEFEQARDDFQKVLQLYPNNKAAKTQVAICQRQLKEQHEKDKRLYANMFQKFAERDAKKEAEKVKEQKEQQQENGEGMDIEGSGAQEQMAA